MNTERLYYTHPEVSRTKARVLDIRKVDSVAGVTDVADFADVAAGFDEVVLDRTIFFPGGGGQPCDLGSLAGFKLVEVKEDAQGNVVHVVRAVSGSSDVDGSSRLKVGDEVELVLDVARRRDHTQQHSGQHLLSAVLEHECGIHTISFHLGTEYTTIDVTGQLLEKAEIQKVETCVNAWIGDARSIITHVCPPEDLVRFKVRRDLPQGQEIIRIVEIDGYDWVACCGTHARSTAKLRAFKILSCEKYKGGTRIYFVAGDRAVALLSRYFDLAKDAAALLGGSVEALVERVSALNANVQTLELERNGLVKERAKFEVDAAMDGSVAGPDGSVMGQGECFVLPASSMFSEGARLIVFKYANRSAAAALESVKAGANRGAVTVALVEPEHTVLFMAPKLAGAPNLASALKAKMSQYGGSGGGQAGSFRAVFPDEKHALSFLTDIQTLLSGVH